ncbi:cytochrome c oxidase subunit CcoM [Marinobacter lutaoensis]|jgi:cbb3-type cytochrome oxidase subunit 3|uniref:cytochrome c oxidase subunit CcoM n=1 Tax=Marinobacter lutaoensis TaxID=135739 RepID=UPI001592FB0B|nr:cytochrome c oxidase subunit CcoM [Marinobacter lutaoensis]NVD35045.1 hypothetical protein [Marinobacter lutaoensis]|tara:strand:+ start:4852 stop:5007 length:156 start_codon:yes stop_codon:yes gene_type:complete
MYMDAVVIAGIVTVLLMLGFFVGVAVFVMRDQKRHAEDVSKRQEKHGGRPV